MQGPKAWEIMPCWGWTKGSAVRLIFADVGVANAAVLYAGDGANDAEAIEVVAAMGGITLGIGPHPPTGSQYHLPNPATLLQFLGSSRWLFGKKEALPSTVPQGLFGIVRFLEIHATDGPHVSE